MGNLKDKEILRPGDGYITVFPSYNKTADGMYLKDWDDVVARLDKPVLLNTTQKDFAKMSDTLSLKFRAGGYDAGPCPLVRNLKTGNIKPSREKGVPRPSVYNIIVLDADGGKDAQGKKIGVSAGFDQRVQDILGDYEYYMHATISSTATAPRRRLLIPVAVPVTADVREAIIRYLAEMLGMSDIDPASKNNKQMMCMPVHLADGDQYHYHNTGRVMVVTDWLNEHATGWDSVANWPIWDTESKIRTQRTSSNREKKYVTECGEWMPIPNKNKVHDAYNRTYKVTDILSESGKYIKTSDRWSHTYDTAKDGIKVTNDAILYSYYGTDPLSVGRDIDAFETALILHHGSLDDKAAWAEMYREAGADEAVRATMLRTLGVDLPESASSWQYMYDSTHEGIAQRCMEYYPHKVRQGNWWRYSGGIYKQVKDVDMVQDALQMIRIAHALQPDDDAISSMVGSVPTAKHICTAWKSLASAVELPDEQWENQPWYLNFTDCTIDLLAYCQHREYKLEHSPEYLLTVSTGYAWADVESVDPQAMDEVINNLEMYLPVNELRDYLQMALGRSLTAVACNEDKCIWLLSASSGRDGANGKSTLLYGISGALGDYYYSLESDCLYYSSRDRNTEGPSPAKAKMKDKRFVNFSEYDYLRTLDDAKYKNTTSAGESYARGCYADGGVFQLSCCCTIDTNGLPGIRKRSYSMLRRTRFIPFDAKLTGDTDVRTRWMHDHKIHVAIMVWLLLGLQMWYDNGRRIDNGIDTAPEAVKTTTYEWHNSFDDPDNFFNDYYVVTRNDDDYLIADDCWKAYQEQVYDRGASRHMFRQAEARWLREQGITAKAKRYVNDWGLRRNCYIGVKLIGTYSATHKDYGAYNHISVVKDNEDNNKANDNKPNEAKKVVQANIFNDKDIAEVM